MAAIPAPINHWWNRSKSSKPPKDKSTLHTNHSYPSLPNEYEKPDQSPKQSSKFNTIASAIGLKPKKPTVTIQDPPVLLPSQPPYVYVSPRTSRPHSKAVSTTTEDDSFELRTPVDSQLSYPKSIMTLSDSDPFASNEMILDQDPNRLSVLSNSSKLSAISESAPRHRQSYACSSHGHHPARERMISESALPKGRAPLPAHMTARTLMVRTNTDGDSRFLEEPRVISPSFLPSPSSVQFQDDGVVRAQSLTPQRPARPRGMTDIGPGPPQFSKNPMSPPLVLVRQPSLPRMAAPPPNTAPPPDQALPPVPCLDKRSRSASNTPPPSASTSSSISFAGSLSDVDEPRTTHSFPRDDRGLRPFPGSDRTKDSSPNLRQPLSTSSLPAETHKLVKKSPSKHRLNSPPPTPVGEEHSESPSGYYFSSTPFARTPKKQRSFHHPHILTPPLPSLRHASSFTPSDTTPEAPREKEKEKRESAASLPRRRLFPVSMRRTSSNQTNNGGADEDPGPVSSDTDRYATSFSNPFALPGSESAILSPSAYHPEEPLVTSPTNLVDQRRASDTMSEYTPQQIMSPADMLKLEAEIREEDEKKKSEASTSKFGDNGSTVGDLGLYTPSQRCRGNSFAGSVMSGATTFSAGAFTDKLETPPSISFHDQHSSHIRVRFGSGGPSTLDAFHGGRTRSSSTTTAPLSPLEQPRPSTSQGTMNHTFASAQSETFGISLPAPPRRRRTVHPTPESNSSSRSSIVVIQPLSPPPIRRKKSAVSTVSGRSALSTASSQSELKSPPSAFNNGLPRRSIMKKPSFLDIEDEAETELGSGGRAAVRTIRRMRSTSSSIEGSFLDLGRGGDSFDTVRTTSTEGYS